MASYYNWYPGQDRDSGRGRKSNERVCLLSTWNYTESRQGTLVSGTYSTGYGVRSTGGVQLELDGTLANMDDGHLPQTAVVRASYRSENLQSGLALHGYLPGAWHGMAWRRVVHDGGRGWGGCSVSVLAITMTGCPPTEVPFFYLLHQGSNATLLSSAACVRSSIVRSGSKLGCWSLGAQPALQPFEI